MTEHRGVGLIVTNPTGTRFYLQRKDGSYRQPHTISVFGGALSPWA